MARHRGQRDVGGHDEDPGQGCAATFHQASEAEGSMGRVAKDGGQITAA